MKIKLFRIGHIDTNCYIVYDDKTKEAVVIDPAASDKAMSDFIEDNGLRVKYTINTHGHYDHIGGNKALGFPVLIHEADAGCLKNPLKNLSITSGEVVPAVEASRFLKDGDTIEINSMAFKVVHTPGHTPGSITLERGDILFTGDTLFYRGVGRTDLPFADQDKLEKSLKKLFAYPDGTKIYPGHGPISTIGDERKYYQF